MMDLRYNLHTLTLSAELPLPDLGCGVGLERKPYRAREFIRLERVIYGG